MAASSTASRVCTLSPTTARVAGEKYWKYDNSDEDDDDDENDEEDEVLNKTLNC